MSQLAQFDAPVRGGLKIHQHVYLLACAAMAFLVCSPVFGQVTATDATKDQSGGKNLTNVGNNVDNLRQLGTSIVIGVFALVGVIMCGVSIVALHKATKDDREKPAGAIAGLLCGGALTAVSFIVWVVHNSLTN